MEWKRQALLSECPFDNIDDDNTMSQHKNNDRQIFALQFIWVAGSVFFFYYIREMEETFNAF